MAKLSAGLQPGLSVVLVAVTTLGCGPGEVEQPKDDLSATEVCKDRCEVRAACDPDASDPDADGCFDVCMDLIAITEDSECGVAMREVQACIGALDCEEYERTMAPNTAEDPCAAEVLAFAELKCGAMEMQP